MAVAPAHLLAVEDTPADAVLLREALREWATPPVLHVVEDGEAALAFLRRSAPYTNAPRPDLVLLDFSLPAGGAQKVLTTAKQDAALLQIPIVVFSTSSSDRDEALASSYGADAYVHKPVDLEDYLAVVRAVEWFWWGLSWRERNSQPIAPAPATGQPLTAGLRTPDLSDRARMFCVVAETALRTANRAWAARSLAYAEQTHDLGPPQRRTSGPAGELEQRLAQLRSLLA